jgi:hypothetical protein
VITNWVEGMIASATFPLAMSWLTAADSGLDAGRRDAARRAMANEADAAKSTVPDQGR